MAELLKAREVYDSIINKTIDYTDNAILRTPIEYDHSDTINPDKDMSIVSTVSDIALTLGTAPYEGYELPITNMASTGSCYVVFKNPSNVFTCIAIANQQTIKLRGVMEGRWELGNDETLAVYNLSNKPTGYNTPNDWRTFYGIGSHQVAYCGNGISTDYSLPANNCIVTVAWQNSTQANATCSSGENVWISAYENNAWGAWKESGNDILFVTYNGSYANKTFSEIVTARSAKKGIIVTYTNLNGQVFYYNYSYSDSYSTGISYGQYICFQRIDQKINFTPSTRTVTRNTTSALICTSFDQWYTLDTNIQNELTSQNKLDPSYIDWNTDYQSITQAQKTGLLGLADWARFQDANPIIIDSNYTTQTLEVSGIQSRRVTCTEASQKIIIDDASEIVAGDNITITSDHSSTESFELEYADKGGTTASITLNADQWGRFIWNGTGFICEHTISLTSIDENNNQYTYDVVVRN